MTRKLPLSVHVGTCWVPSSGGSYVAPREYMLALDGAGVSFTPRNLSSAIVSDSRVHHIIYNDSKMNAGFGYAPVAAGSGAMSVAAQAKVLFCHVCLRYNAIWVWRLAKSMKLPYFVVPHGCLDPYVFTYRRLRKRIWTELFLRRFLADAAGVICCTNRELAKARPLLRNTPANCVYLPVSVPQVRLPSDVRMRLRAEMGIPSEARVLISVGRLHPSKNPDMMVRAFAAGSAPNGHLILVGPSDGMDELRCKEGVDPETARRIHFVGAAFGDERMRYLSVADGYISLSQKENFGLAVAEGLAMGLPCILSPGIDLAWDMGGSEAVNRLATTSDEAGRRAIAEFYSMSQTELRGRACAATSWVCENLSHERFSQHLRDLVWRVCR